jgi:hypothetical protein
MADEPPDADASPDGEDTERMLAEIKAQIAASRERVRAFKASLTEIETGDIAPGGDKD